VSALFAGLRCLEYEKAKAVIASAKVTEAAGYLHTDAQFFIGDYTIWTIVFPD